MSILDIQLRSAIQLFYAPDKLRRKILKDYIRRETKRKSEQKTRDGGNFFTGFWSDVKKHVSGTGDLQELTKARIEKSKTRERLYPKLADGVLILLNEKLRWSNEEIQIRPKSVHGMVRFDDLGARLRVSDAICAKVRENYTRVVYPYFSEHPSLPEEGGRIGLWAMQTALPEINPLDMRLIDILRRKFYSPIITELSGNEDTIFKKYYAELIQEYERIKAE